jgi:hypothetical protein
MELLAESWVDMQRPYLTPRELTRINRKIAWGNALLDEEYAQQRIELFRRLRPLAWRLAMLEMTWCLKSLKFWPLVKGFLWRNAGRTVDFEQWLIGRRLANIEGGDYISDLDGVRAVDAVSVAYDMGAYVVRLNKSESYIIVSTVEWRRSTSLF